jgi:hypothetical protein
MNIGPTTIEKDTFRGMVRYRVVKMVKGRDDFLGFVRRAINSATRWQWIEGFGPIVSSMNYTSRAKAVEALVAHLESKPEKSIPKKLETIGRGRLFGKARSNHRNRRVHERR